MFYKDALEFQENTGHLIGGEWYPRVTKIVEIKSKPALYRFYSAVGFANGERIKEQSATEGTMVHEAVESILIGEEPEVPEVVRPAVAAFGKWLSENEVEAYPELIERKIIHPEFRYAGTVDALVKLNGQFGILDIKTSKSIYRDYDLQTAAYFDALKGDYPDLTTRWILRIDQAENCFNCGATRRTKGGREKIDKPWPARNGVCSPKDHVWSDKKGVIELKEARSPASQDFEAFMAAKRLWEWENEFWLKRIGYL